MNSKFLAYSALIALHTGLLVSNVKEITSAEEYTRVKKNATRPTIIVFNSSSCDACVTMEPFIKAASEKPEFQEAEFYIINTQNGALKGLEKSEKILAYPTTFFIKPGKEEPRRERGGMSEAEVNDITYELIYGKKRPQPPVKKTKEPVKKEE